MQVRDKHIGKMEKQLQAWGAKLDIMSANAKAAGANAKTEERRLVADLTKKRDAMQARLDELEEAGGEKWDTLKTGIENAYDELEDAFKKLIH